MLLITVIIHILLLITLKRKNVLVQAKDGYLTAGPTRMIVGHPSGTTE